MRSAFLNTIYASVVILATVTPGACAAARLPECPASETGERLVRPAIALALPSEITLIYRSATRAEVVIDAGFNSDGKLLCASPLAGRSIYWNWALEALRKRSDFAGARAVFVFADPSYATARQLTERPETPHCSGKENLEAALESGFGNLLSHMPAEAKTCFSTAAVIDPHSVAAEYGSAVAAGLMRDSMSEIEHYQRVALMAPWFYEARVQLAAAQRFAGQTGVSDETLRSILDESPPLPIQRQVNNALVFGYDREGKRREAVGAQRSLVVIETELRRRVPSLVDATLLILDRKDLADREEEAGEYPQAANDFAEVAAAPADAKVSEAVRFEADLGRIRAIRRLGQNDEARRGCTAWGKRLAVFGVELENQHWGGKSLAMSQWEFSCGDWEQGIRLIEAEMKRKPTSDSAYLVLEKAYRARGETTLANEAHALAERIRAAHDQAVLNSILAEAGALAAQGGEMRVK